MTWLRRPILGVPLSRWLVAAGIAVAVWALFGWGWAIFSGAGSLFNFGVARLRARQTDDTPEAAHARAVRVSEQAEARRVVLDREERAAGASIEDAARHAAEDPLDEVDARIRREAGERRR